MCSAHLYPLFFSVKKYRLDLNNLISLYFFLIYYITLVNVYVALLIAGTPYAYFME